MDKKNHMKRSESLCPFESFKCNKEKISSCSEERSVENEFDPLPIGMACCSGEYVSDHSSLLSLQPWIFRKECYQEDADKVRVNGEFSDSNGFNGLSDAFQAKVKPRNINLSFGRRRGRNSPRSRQFHAHPMKPITSVGDCLIPQLYNDDFELKKYALNSVPSSLARSVRPLIITDGDRIISKSTYATWGVSSNSELIKEDYGMISEATEAVVGVPPLPQFRSPKRKNNEKQHCNLETSNSQSTCRVTHSQESPSGMLLFCLGINIGVISTIISNKSEVERLNDMLKNTENLVQDLQEELEMKDSMTVKELDDVTETQRLDNSYSNIDASTDLLSSQFPASCPTSAAEIERPHFKTVETSELNRIEAELEAELERLELNLNSSSLEGKMSAFGELDPDIMADVVRGELRAPRGEPEANMYNDGTSTTETHNVNYTVSPKELSLRLHEVIRFRLEERIAELEGELHHSQTQVELMKAELLQSQTPRSFSNSEIESYSATPLCLNLSGDALHAYGEAYEEFMKMTDLQEQLPSATNVCKDVDGDGMLRSNWSRIEEGDSSSRDFSSIESDNEEEKMLIQQIVERIREGSPSRMLFTMDK